MELIKKLQDPELVVRFQQVCGIHRLPACEGGEAVNDVDNRAEKLTENNDTHEYENYVKHRHKYVLKDSCASNNNNSRKTAKLNSYSTNSTNQGIFPPFGSDDSDSDNGVSSGDGRPRLTPHVVRNRFFYYVFKFASLGGDESFYLTFLPFCLWNLDSYVLRHTVMVWSLTMYLGQATKDMLRHPRPPSPPVVRLETDYTEEYSWPSTHAVAGTTIPFMLGYTMLTRYQVPPSLVIGVCLIWAAMVCLSRLYLGVHTVWDIIGGCFYGFTMISIFIPIVDKLDWFFQTHLISPVVLFLTCLLLTVCYPNPVMGNNTKGDAVQIIASVTGCLLGEWMNYFNEMSYIVERPELMVLAFPTLKDIATSILRFIVGGVALIFIKLVVKAVSVKGISHVIGLSKPDSNNHTVKIWYKFITYMSLGVIITWTAPILHGRFGLGRPGFYAEVL